MRIEIENDIFTGANKFSEIAHLFYSLVYRNRYEVFIDYISLQENENFNKFSKEDFELIEQTYINIIETSKNPDFYVSNNSIEKKFNLEEAIRFFNEPVIIMLENDLYDQYFINAIFKTFTKESKLINTHFKNNWLKYRLAGGATNIPNAISSILKEFDNLPKENYKYLRAIVIIDSDREYPKALIKPDKQKVIEFCNNNQIEIHILEKREMENYVPDEVIDDIAFNNNDEYLKTYLKLNPIQKDYFDIEKGFDNKNIKSFSNEIQNLYENLQENDLKILRKGLISENFKGKGKKVKSEFPKLFEHPNISKQLLLKRTQHQNNKNELVEIISKINVLL